MRLCDNSCPAFFTNDGVCDDGGEGSRWNNCGALGTDCADCGERTFGGPDIIDEGESVEYTHNTTLQVAAAVATIVFLLFWGGLCLFVAWRGFGKTKAQAEEMLRGAKGNLLRDLHRLHPDIDTVLFTSHRDGSNAAGCVSELVAISGTWKPFSCPAHPRLRRNGGPCTCKIPQAIKCRGFKGCTPAWMNSHKYIC